MPATAADVPIARTARRRRRTPSSSSGGPRASAAPSAASARRAAATPRSRPPRANRHDVPEIAASDASHRARAASVARRWRDRKLMAVTTRAQPLASLAADPSARRRRADRRTARARVRPALGRRAPSGIGIAPPSATRTVARRSPTSVAAVWTAKPAHGAAGCRSTSTSSTVETMRRPRQRALRSRVRQRSIASRCVAARASTSQSGTRRASRPLRRAVDLAAADRHPGRSQ